MPKEVMMRILLAILAAALVVGSTSVADAVAVVSANGFKCTQQSTSNNKALVECIGQFPGVDGFFAGTGYDIVHVEYSPDNKKRYFFMSETGCFILNASDKTALATDRSGTKKQFSAFMDAMEWCYSESKSASTSTTARVPFPPPPPPLKLP
jgi:hypothetical protein